MEKIAAAIILLLSTIQTVPPLFSGTEYFDNVFFINVFTLFAFLGVVIPYTCPNLWWPLKVASNTIAGWYIAALTFEVVNLWYPEEQFNSMDNNLIYPKCLISFALIISLSFTSYKWSKRW